MKNIHILLIALITIISCNKSNENNEEEYNDTVIVKTKKLTKNDSLRIYTSIRNQKKVSEAQTLLDSIKKSDPEKYENIKIIINDSYIELFKEQMYEASKEE